MAKAKLHPSFFRGIAHRGLHDDKLTENGLLAFSRAIDAGLCFEYDVHLTKDDEVLVCHDSELERVTGKKGIIEELTLEEIKKDYSLLDGEKIPTLKEVLALNQWRSGMVVELKVYKGNYKRLAKRTIEELSGCPDKSKVTIISFDPRALLKCRHKGYTRGLLVYNKRTDIFAFRRFFEYLDVEDCLLDDKRVVSFREKGRKVNVWTIDSVEKLEKAKGKADMITFELIPLEKVKEFADGR